MTKRNAKSLIFGIVVASAFFATRTFADVVYVSSSPLGGCTVTANCTGPNTDGTYTEVNFPTLGDFGARGTAAGRPSMRPAPRGYVGSANITDTTAGVDLMPDLGFPNAVYQIDYNFSSTAANTTTNVVMSVSCPSGGTLSFTQTTKLQRQYGTPATQWQFMGYITNTAVKPTISFRYQSGTVSGGSQNRLILDTWRFTLVQPCLSVPPVSVTGPLSTNVNQVVVSGVSASATAVTVYQNSGSGFVAIGSKTSGVTAGNNTVTVSGLAPLAAVGATQTVGGQEGCTPSAGTIVGGGANPSVRIALSIRETSSTGPAGQAGNTSSQIIHFLGATQVASGAPVDAPVFYPSNTWQTVSFQSGTLGVGDTANVLGFVAPGAGYAANDYVDIAVYPYKTVNGLTAYSANPIYSAWAVGYMYSNDVYQVQWTWDAVPGATGYRVVRQVNFAGYNDYRDITNNSYTDANTGWIAGPPTVTPNTVPLTPSIQWNPSVGNSNNIATPWGILESIDFSIDGPDPGPFDLYIDNLQNGTNVFQTFEDTPSGTSAYFFLQPSFSGTTSGNILTDPNVSAVSNLAADTGANSLHVRFQWSGTNNTKWLRFTTSGANPMVDMADPISFRMLLLPVGKSVTPPTRPVITATRVGNSTVLNWTGTHGLQSAPAVSGPYTTINGVTSGPYTNANSGSQTFFRLIN